MLALVYLDSTFFLISQIYFRAINHSKMIPCTTGAISFKYPTDSNQSNPTMSTQSANFSTRTRPLNRSEKFNIRDLVDHVHQQPQRAGPSVQYNRSDMTTDSSDIVRPSPNRDEIINKILHLTASLSRSKLPFMREVCNLIFPRDPKWTIPGYIHLDYIKTFLVKYDC